MDFDYKSNVKVIEKGYRHGCNAGMGWRYAVDCPDEATAASVAKAIKLELSSAGQAAVSTRGSRVEIRDMVWGSMPQLGASNWDRIKLPGWVEAPRRAG